MAVAAVSPSSPLSSGAQHSVCSGGCDGQQQHSPEATTKHVQQCSSVLCSLCLIALHSRGLFPHPVYGIAMKESSQNRAQQLISSGKILSNRTWKLTEIRAELQTLSCRQGQPPSQGHQPPAVLTPLSSSHGTAAQQVLSTHSSTEPRGGPGSC